MLNYQNSLTFNKDQHPEEMLRNFWAPEDGFVWSTGKWCEIIFSFEVASSAPRQLGDLILDIDVFKQEDVFKGQNVLFYLNGLRIGSLFSTKRATVVFSFDAALLKAEENILTIDTPDVKSPSEFGSKDARLLGVQLFSLQIRKID